jgi:hypothetical protein
VVLFSEKWRTSMLGTVKSHTIHVYVYVYIYNPMSCYAVCFCFFCFWAQGGYLMLPEAENRPEIHCAARWVRRAAWDQDCTLVFLCFFVFLFLNAFPPAFESPCVLWMGHWPSYSSHERLPQWNQ